jgi:hypothetical protein
MSHLTRRLAHQRSNLAFFICKSSSGTNHRSLSSLWSWRRNSAASIQSSLSEMGLRRTPICAAFLYAFWEPFIAWGIIAALLLWFRGHLNQPSATWEWLGRRAYAVYIIHPPVLVGISLLLHRWVAPASPRGSWPIRWFACPGSPSGNACGIQTDCGGTARIPFEQMGVNRRDFLFAYAALPEDALYTDPLPQTSFLRRSSSREPLHRSCQLL